MIYISAIAMKQVVKYIGCFILLTVWYLWANKVANTINLINHGDNFLTLSVQESSKLSPLVSPTSPAAEPPPIETAEPTCHLDKSTLIGPLVVNKTVPRSMEEIEKDLPFVNLGGWWKPTGCKSEKAVAVIIPYRNRLPNLLVLLRPLHKILRRQNLNYRVFLSEQWDDLPFNKGKINNAGFLSTSKFGDYECIVFQDADYIPENDYNMYDCPNSPRHMAPLWEEFGYQRIAEKWMGGVIAITKTHLKEMNGWSNLYWGWGGEDDDFYERVIKSGKKLYKPGDEGRYAKAKHNAPQRNEERMTLLRKTRKKNFDLWLTGLNNIRYKFLGAKEEKLYTHLKIHSDMQPSEYNQTSLMKKRKDYSKL